MGRFLEKVGWGGQLGGIQNQPGGFEEKCLVTLRRSKHLIERTSQALANFFVKNQRFIEEILIRNNCISKSHLR